VQGVKLPIEEQNKNGVLSTLKNCLAVDLPNALVSPHSNQALIFLSPPVSLI